jgi:hypothetical protein
LIALLDALHAAERAGADAVEHWVASCRDPGLRGGLRVICARDRRHAALAEARLRALGGVPSATVGPDLTALCGVVADPGVSDRSKLTLLLARLPSDVEGTFAAIADVSEIDAETHALLNVIGEEDRASLRWLRAMGESMRSADVAAGANGS